MSFTSFEHFGQHYFVDLLLPKRRVPAGKTAKTRFHVWTTQNAAIFSGSPGVRISYGNRKRVSLRFQRRVERLFWTNRTDFKAF